MFFGDLLKSIERHIRRNVEVVYWIEKKIDRKNWYNWSLRNKLFKVRTVDNFKWKIKLSTVFISSFDDFAGQTTAATGSVSDYSVQSIVYEPKPVTGTGLVELSTNFKVINGN